MTGLAHWPDDSDNAFSGDFDSLSSSGLSLSFNLSKNYTSNNTSGSGSTSNPTTLRISSSTTNCSKQQTNKSSLTGTLLSNLFASSSASRENHNNNNNLSSNHKLAWTSKSAPSSSCVNQISSSSLLLDGLDPISLDHFSQLACSASLDMQRLPSDSHCFKRFKSSDGRANNSPNKRDRDESDKLSQRVQSEGEGNANANANVNANSNASASAIASANTNTNTNSNSNANTNANTKKSSKGEPKPTEPKNPNLCKLSTIKSLSQPTISQKLQSGQKNPSTANSSASDPEIDDVNCGDERQQQVVKAKSWLSKRKAPSPVASPSDDDDDEIEEPEEEDEEENEQDEDLNDESSRLSSRSSSEGDMRTASPSSISTSSHSTSTRSNSPSSFAKKKKRGGSTIIPNSTKSAAHRNHIKGKRNNNSSTTITQAKDNQSTTATPNGNHVIATAAAASANNVVGSIKNIHYYPLSSLMGKDSPYHQFSNSSLNPDFYPDYKYHSLETSNQPLQTPLILCERTQDHSLLKLPPHGPEEFENASQRFSREWAFDITKTQNHHSSSNKTISTEKPKSLSSSSSGTATSDNHHHHHTSNLSNNIGEINNINRNTGQPQTITTPSHVTTNFASARSSGTPKGFPFNYKSDPGHGDVQQEPIDLHNISSAAFQQPNSTATGPATTVTATATTRQENDSSQENRDSMFNQCMRHFNPDNHLITTGRNQNHHNGQDQELDGQDDNSPSAGCGGNGGGGGASSGSHSCHGQDTTNMFGSDLISKHKFQYLLWAPISVATKTSEDTMTYLNQGQAYEIKLENVSGGGANSESTRKGFMCSVINIGFHERHMQQIENELWHQWSQQHPDERIFTVDMKLSYNVFGVESDGLNKYEFLWDSSKPAGVFIRINSISTEFTPKKHGGEKGVPFKLSTETYSYNSKTHDSYFVSAAYCQIKVFKPKGAERKFRSDREKISKKHVSEQEKYHKSRDQTCFKECTIGSLHPFADSNNYYRHSHGHFASKQGLTASSTPNNNNLNNNNNSNNNNNNSNNDHSNGVTQQDHYQSQHQHQQPRSAMSHHSGDDDQQHQQQQQHHEHGQSFKSMCLSNPGDSIKPAELSPDDGNNQHQHHQHHSQHSESDPNRYRLNDSSSNSGYNLHHLANNKFHSPPSHLNTDYMVEKLSQISNPQCRINLLEDISLEHNNFYLNNDHLSLSEHQPIRSSSSSSSSAPNNNNNNNNHHRTQMHISVHDNNTNINGRPSNDNDAPPPPPPPPPPPLPSMVNCHHNGPFYHHQHQQATRHIPMATGGHFGPLPYYGHALAAAASSSPYASTQASLHAPTNNYNNSNNGPRSSSFASTQTRPAYLVNQDFKGKSQILSGPHSMQSSSSSSCSSSAMAQDAFKPAQQQQHVTNLASHGFNNSTTHYHELNPTSSTNHLNSNNTITHRAFNHNHNHHQHNQNQRDTKEGLPNHHQQNPDNYDTTSSSTSSMHANPCQAYHSTNSLHSQQQTFRQQRSTTTLTTITSQGSSFMSNHGPAPPLASSALALPPPQPPHLPQITTQNHASIGSNLFDSTGGSNSTSNYWVHQNNQNNPPFQLTTLTTSNGHANSCSPNRKSGFTLINNNHPETNNNNNNDNHNHNNPSPNNPPFSLTSSHYQNHLYDNPSLNGNVGYDSDHNNHHQQIHHKSTSLSPTDLNYMARCKSNQPTFPEHHSNESNLPRNCSFLITVNSNCVEVMAWLNANRFSPFIKALNNFSGADLLRLSKNELIDICGLSDGIRLNNCLHNQPIKPRKTLYIRHQHNEIFHPIYLYNVNLDELLKELSNIISSEALVRGIQQETKQFPTKTVTPRKTNPLDKSNDSKATNNNNNSNSNSNNTSNKFSSASSTGSSSPTGPREFINNDDVIVYRDSRADVISRLLIDGLTSVRIVATEQVVQVLENESVWNLSFVNRSGSIEVCLSTCKTKRNQK